MAEPLWSVYSNYYIFPEGGWNMDKAASMEPDGKRAPRGKVPATGLWWAMIDWARAPVYYVVLMYVFSAYFAESVVGDHARGQVLFSSAIALTGAFMAVLSPFLGGFVDEGGRRKPVLLALFIVMAAACSGLALAASGVSYAIPLAMVLLGVTAIAYSVSELLHNALLPASAGPRHVSMVSGLGLSLGSLAAVIVLVGLIYFLEKPPAGLTGEDVARLSGLVCAVWMLVFIVPALAGLKDHYREGARWRTARFIPRSWSPVKTVATLFREHPAIMRLLIARMIFMDGLTALFTIGAVYVAGVLEWSAGETAAMGILSTCSAVFGGILGGWLGRRFGSRNAIIIELAAITLIFCFQIGISPEAAFFGLLPLDPAAADRSMFPRVVDLVYLGTVVPLSAFVIAAYASCRSLLVHYCPQDRVGYFFGIYAMTSTITIWLGPALVSLVTQVFDSQRIGFGSLSILFVAGLALMQRLPKDRPDQKKS